ncbi:MAG: hypothetical protein AAF617_18220, partial [Bacteroidota bacterium]
TVTRWCMAIIVCCLLSSCYSVRLKNQYGDPEPDPLNDVDTYYRYMKVREIKETVNASIIENFERIIDDCPQGIYIVEYRNTFGGLLLNLVTFGSKRRVKAKYVCLKPTN